MEEIVTRRQIRTRSILVIGLAVLVATAGGFAISYHLSLEGTRQQLQEMVRSQARLMEAVGKHDAFSPIDPAVGSSFSATLGQIKAAHERGFGETGEIVIGRRVGDEIVFFLPSRSRNHEIPPPVPWNSDLAEPMRLALSGETGLVEARDHSGNEVMAAYEYLPFLEVGMVAKLHKAEVTEPFVMAGQISALLALIAVAVAAFVNARAVTPLIDSVTQREERIRTLVESTPDGMLILGGDGCIALVNAQIETLFGFSRRELLGQPVEMLIPERFREGHVARRDGYLASPKRRSMGEGGDLFGLRKDGTEFQVDISLNPIQSGTQTQALGIVRDVTASKKAERQVRQLSRAVEESPSAVFVTDRDGRIEYVNHAFVELSGYDLEELVGENPRLFKSGGQPEAFYRDLWETILRGENWQGELVNHTRDGRDFWVSESISPMADEHGEITHFVTVMEDITERKRTELRGKGLGSLSASSAAPCSSAGFPGRLWAPPFTSSSQSSCGPVSG